MDKTPEAFRNALASGDTERVNSAIRTVEDMSLEERSAIFDACFEACRELYDTDDGYRRQSVVRFAAALYPRLALRTVGYELSDDTLPDEFTLDEISSHRRRLREFYLIALVDGDGRVRRAAAKALKEVALAAELVGAEEELETMLTEIETVAADIDDPDVGDHVHQAYENVAFHARETAWQLPDDIRDAFE